VADGLVVDERLGQPLPGVDLAPLARRAQVVDGEPRCHRREVRLRRVRLDVRFLVAKEGVLDDVLRFGNRSEHPVGDREQVGTQLLVTLHRHQ
jgi:hypothetical protein